MKMDEPEVGEKLFDGKCKPVNPGYNPAVPDGEDPYHFGYIHGHSAGWQRGITKNPYLATGRDIEIAVGYLAAALQYKDVEVLLSHIRSAINRLSHTEPTAPD